MARVLLVNTNREGTFWTVVPAGLCAVAGAASAAGHEVHTVDLRFARRPAAVLRRALRRVRPDVIGLSIRNIDSVASWGPFCYLDEIREELVPACREAAAPIVVGGPAVGVGGQALVDDVGADWGIAGEGEDAFPRLLRALSRGEAPDGVPGLLRRGATPPSGWAPARLDRLSEVRPLELDRWIDAGAYWRAGATYPLLTRRGCPFRCAYCVYPRLEGHGSRLRSPEAVADEVRAAAARGVRSFEFVDSVFGVPEDHAVAVCEAIRGAGLRVSLQAAGLHPLGVTPRVLDALEGAGARGVLFTPDAFSAAALEGLGKGFGMDVVARAAGLLRSRRLDVCWFLVLGGPGETPSTLRESLRFVEREIPRRHLVIVNVGLRIYPGTALAAQARARGMIAPADALLRPVWYIEPGLNVKDIHGLLSDLVVRCPNVVVMGEEPRRAWARLALGRTLRWIAGPRPAWAALPELFRWFARMGCRRLRPPH